MLAIVSDNELGEVREISWPELKRQVASIALMLRGLGVQRGDRVAAYLPNVPETIVALLACSSIGAIWSVRAPDMGTAAVTDRFRQIEPKLLIAVDGVHYGGEPLDRSAVVQQLRAQLPSVQKLLLLKTPFARCTVGADALWSDALARNDAEVATFEPEWPPFDHPIWIVPDIWWCNVSGGTDFCGAFVGGNRELPEVPGQMQCRLLGNAVEAWNEHGQSVIGEVGELVCTRPIPSMPLYFWGDEGNARYLSSYFDTYPGVWRHGDWIRDRRRRRLRDLRAQRRDDQSPGPAHGHERDLPRGRSVALSARLEGRRPRVPRHGGSFVGTNPVRIGKSPRVSG
jgi:acyl-coenzyme A synthetase/AMP-(fatty) acid ligase